MRDEPLIRDGRSGGCRAFHVRAWRRWPELKVFESRIPAKAESKIALMGMTALLSQSAYCDLA
jgi:hypothetical protein